MGLCSHSWLKSNLPQPDSMINEKLCYEQHAHIFKKILKKVVFKVTYIYIALLSLYHFFYPLLFSHSLMSST